MLVSVPRSSACHPAHPLWLALRGYLPFGTCLTLGLSVLPLWPKSPLSPWNGASPTCPLDVLPMAEKDEVTFQNLGDRSEQKGILLIVHSLHWSPTYSLPISIENVPQLQSGKDIPCWFCEFGHLQHHYTSIQFEKHWPHFSPSHLLILPPPNLPIAKWWAISCMDDTLGGSAVDGFKLTGQNYPAPPLADVLRFHWAPWVVQFTVADFPEDSQLLWCTMTVSWRAWGWLANTTYWHTLQTFREDRN